eukprot:UN05975
MTMYGDYGDTVYSYDDFGDFPSDNYHTNGKLDSGFLDGGYDNHFNVLALEMGVGIILLAYLLIGYLCGIASSIAFKFIYNKTKSKKVITQCHHVDAMDDQNVV